MTPPADAIKFAPEMKEEAIAEKVAPLPVTMNEMPAESVNSFETELMPRRVRAALLEISKAEFAVRLFRSTFCETVMREVGAFISASSPEMGVSSPCQLSRSC